MPWKEVRNDQPPYKEVSYSGECPKHHKKATVTGIYFGRKIAESDLQKTYSLSGYICTLENGGCSFANHCPFMPEKYL